MPRISAKIRILAGLRRRGEGQLGLLAGVEQFGGEQDLRGIGHVEPQKGIGLRRHFFGRLPDLLQRARRDDHEVVLHGVVVLQKNLDRLAGFHDDKRFVVEHLLGNRVNDENARAQRTQRLADCAGLLLRQQRSQIRGELKGVDRVRLYAFIHRNRLQVSHHAFDQRLCLVSGPGGARNLLQAGDRSGAFRP